MKFNKFKHYITKRQDILKAATRIKKRSAINILYEVVDSIEKDMGDSFKKIPSIFSFDARYFFKTCLKKYFDNKKLSLRLCKHNGNYCVMLEGTKLYELAPIDNEIILKCLYDTNYLKGWDELFNEFSDLKEFLWYVVEKTFISEKKEQISLIQKMIEEKTEEISVLESPKKIEQRKNELIKEKYELKYEKKKLEETIDEV